MPLVHKMPAPPGGDTMIIRIILTVLLALAAVSIGLLLRRWLVRRLKKTILDDWIVHTLGIIIIFPPLIIAAIAAPFILNSSLIIDLWNSIKNQVHVQDVTALVWSFIETVLIILLGLGIARTAMKQTIRGLGENRLDVNLRTLIGRIFFILIILVAFFWILSIWHVSIDLPIALLGTLTVAFTFAIQDILKDLVAGFYILMERPFHIGDLITISNSGNQPLHTGTVEDIQLRTTRIRITSGEQVIVPNALVFGGVVINNSYYVQRRVTLTLTLPEEAFIQDETPKAIIKALKACGKVMAKPEPMVLINGYAEKKITLKVYVWVESEQVASVSDVIYTLHAAFPDADLAMVESTSNMSG